MLLCSRGFYSLYYEQNMKGCLTMEKKKIDALFEEGKFEELVGFLEAEVYYDVNVQVAFYLGDEYITTVEKDFHLKGNDSTYSAKAVKYLPASVEYELVSNDILNHIKKGNE